MSGDMAWVDLPQEARRGIEHRMELCEETAWHRRGARTRYRLTCSCGLVVQRPFTNPGVAQAVHVAHAGLATGPAVCPRCSSGKPACRTYSQELRLWWPHEVVCDVPWAEDVCERCDLVMQIQFLPEDAARVSRRMIGAAP